MPRPQEPAPTGTVEAVPAAGSAPRADGAAGSPRPGAATRPPAASGANGAPRQSRGGRPLSYCLFSALYAPHVGGVESYTAGLAKELARRGRRVTVVTCRLFPAHPERETQQDDVEVLRLPCRPLLGGRLPLLRRTAATRRAMDELAASAPDRVVVNTRFYGLSLAGARFALRTGTPAFVVEHGSAHLSLGNPLADKVVEAYEHWATGRVKACGHPFCGVSAASLSWLSHFGIEGRGVVPNAIDLEAFAENASARDFRAELGVPEGAFLVAFVGRLVPEKGVDALLQAAQELARRLPEGSMAFAFAGDGPLAAAVAQASGNVFATGRLNAPDVAALLRDADVLCLPSRSEGFATTLLEAAAVGTPPVVTHVGGVEELGIADRRGIVLQDADPTTLAAALQEAHARRGECPAWGTRLHELAAQTASWTSSADALEALFDAYETERQAGAR